MNLTPELLLEAKFAVSRKGYEVNEVDDFLERCAEGLDVLLTRLRSEFERAEAAEARATELQTRLTEALEARPAPSAPPVPESESPEEGTPAPEPAPPPAPPGPSVEEPMRILVAAERTAEAAIAGARAEAERMKAEAEALVDEARTNAEAEARRAGEEARRSVEAEVLELRRDRDELTTDVRSLSRWLDDQRGRIRAAARDLGRILEDPAALREAPLPEALTTEPGSDVPGDDIGVDDDPDVPVGPPTQPTLAVDADDEPTAEDATD